MPGRIGPRFYWTPEKQDRLREICEENPDLCARDLDIKIADELGCQPVTAMGVRNKMGFKRDQNALNMNKGPPKFGYDATHGGNLTKLRKPKG